MGWDNLPRKLLMYYTNFVSSPEGYFHTVICNSQEFRNTTVNHDLHYIAWDNPPKQHPLSLTLKDFQNMSKSGAPFARKFDREDPVLAFIDKQLLGRAPGRLTPGGWCIGMNQTCCFLRILVSMFDSATIRMLAFELPRICRFFTFPFTLQTNLMIPYPSC